MMPSSCQDTSSATGQFSPSALPDVMFMDIRMPGKSGLDVMREAAPLPSIPIIAMTGNVDVDSVNEYRYVTMRCSPSWGAFCDKAALPLALPCVYVMLCRAAGFVGCVGKPFDVSTLKEALAMALQHRWFCFVSK